jgi:hypothetical protein
MAMCHSSKRNKKKHNLKKNIISNEQKKKVLSPLLGCPFLIKAGADAKWP